MDSRHFDVIVVGLGAMGSAAMYHLARTGHGALGIDMHPLGHAQGSSHGHHRMIRRSSYRISHEPLIKRAFELWPQLEADSGHNIMNLIGEIALGYPREGGRYLDVNLEPTLGGYREVLDEQTVRERFPGVNMLEGMQATYERTAGFLRPEVAIAAHLEVAERLGAAIERPAAVTGWFVDDYSATVTTDDAAYTADRLILTAGPWTTELLKPLGLPLQVVRIVNAYFEPSRPDLWQVVNGAPDFLLSVPEGSYYGMCDIEGAGVKIGRHENGEPTTARSIRREVDEAEVDMLRDVLNRYLPGASGPVKQLVTCMYTMTPDENYIIERHPEYEEVVYGCGFSGTGFKFSCVIGEILAELATTGQTRFDISSLSSARFG